MTKLGVFETLKPTFVQGENIAQTHQFVATGAAEPGFVACFQVIEDGRTGSGSVWLVPANLHEPIRQDAILLAKGKDRPAAIALLNYLKSEKVQTIIKSFGYDLP